MLENNCSATEVEERIADDGESTLLLGASEVPECLRNTVILAWAITGKCSMPSSEHLIPFRI